MPPALSLPTLAMLGQSHSSARATLFQDCSAYTTARYLLETTIMDARLVVCPSSFLLCSLLDFNPIALKPLSKPRSCSATLHEGPQELQGRLRQIFLRARSIFGLTVASPLDSLSESDRRKMLLYLRIGNTNAVDHPIYAEKWVETLPDRLLTYSSDSTDFEQSQEWKRHGWYRNRTIYDSTTLISECYNSGTKYIAILEDPFYPACSGNGRTAHNRPRLALQSMMMMIYMFV
ncbi:hypothetical protein BJX68DRAFT_173118 [Aspergillus pseudodeflectus]|uniref:Uncharacterized protein n=1 Tax=Aspergillus pseudodeflectus TaxID=176178 RepID=A0ABR4JMM5_9EURO